MSTSTSKKRPRPAPAAADIPACPTPTTVRLRSTAGLQLDLPPPDDRLAALAYRWNYIVRNRQRHTPAAYESLQQRSRGELATIGIDDAHLAAFGASGLVEVSIPWAPGDDCWQARIMPWESLLSLATKPWRGDRHLTVVRHLDIARRTHRPAGAIARPLFVASAPGRIARQFDFSNEHRLIDASLGIVCDPLTTPTRRQLIEKIETLRPDLIHLSGVDSHQAETFWPEGKTLSGRNDAFLLATAAMEPDHVESSALGEVLVRAGVPPAILVSLNCYYSASRLAPHVVAAGAHHAIGFHDTIDDSLAERFFAEFYTGWRGDGWGDPLRAFARARLGLSTVTGDRQMGDIALWSARSLVPADWQGSFHTWVLADAATREPAHAPAPTPTPADGGVRRRLRRLATPATPATPARRGPTGAAPETAPALTTPPPTPTETREPIGVRIKTRTHLNYSLLHNDDDLFAEFTVFNFRAPTAFPVEINIELHVGETSFPYRCVRPLTEQVTDLRADIRVPLVASVLRGFRESIQTSLFTEVVHAGAIVHRRTERVTLLPADEWTDARAEWRWLPSFVLPRDEKILAVITAAERYLRALADDAHAGFDGYQRLLADGSNVGLVDVQVRAIWSVLLHDTPLAYINPPPSYTHHAQRLRTPGMVLTECRGTCIDLALLFAACLEYIGLYPVVFLVRGHAFPGYWREPAAHQKLRTFANAESSAPPAAAASDLSMPSVAQPPWVMEAQAFGEIAKALNEGGLVPLETVELTRRGSFAHAVDTGLKNLVTPWGFDALLDIQIARERGVTPLPLSDPLR